MALTSSSKQKLCRKEPDSARGDDNQVKTKRRNCPEVRVVRGRIYHSKNGKTCHQCRQKTMGFVAACKNQKHGTLCTFKFCHKCLFNRYGEKAEDMAVVDDWNCPKCRDICNCSFCMKKRGSQPTGILVHTARATGFSSVSELLHVTGSENVGVTKVIQGTDIRPTKHTASGADRVLSPIKHDENSILEKQKTRKRGVLKENQDGKKTKQGRSNKLKNSNTGDVKQDDMAMLMEIDARVTHSGKQKESQGIVQSKGIFVKETKPSKSKMAIEIPPDQGFKTAPLVSSGVSKKEVKASQTVRALHQDKKIEKVDPKALLSKKIESETESKEQKVIASQKKLDSVIENLQIDVDMQRQLMRNIKFLKKGEIAEIKFQNKEEIAEIKFQNKEEITEIEFQHKDKIVEVVMPKGSELNMVAGIELKPEDAGHALQFLEFCAAFGKILNLKKGEPEYVLRELITGGRARRGKISVVDQFCKLLMSMLLEELGESSKTNGRVTWLQTLKDCTYISQPVLEKLKLKQFGKGTNNYDSFNSSEKLVLLNYICDELLCTEKLRTWIHDQNMKHSEKVKEAQEKVQSAKLKEKHLKQKMQDDIAKAVISKNGASLSISEHDAIISQIKTEAAQAHTELLEAKGIVPDENKKPEAVRTQPIILYADGQTFWKLKGHSGEANFLLQDIGTWDAVISGEKWFTFAEQEKEINEYIWSLRKRNTSKPSLRSRRATKPMVAMTAISNG